MPCLAVPCRAILVALPPCRSLTCLPSLALPCHPCSALPCLAVSPPFAAPPHVGATVRVPARRVRADVVSASYTHESRSVGSASVSFRVVGVGVHVATPCVRVRSLPRRGCIPRYRTTSSVSASFTASCPREFTSPHISSPSTWYSRSTTHEPSRRRRCLSPHRSPLRTRVHVATRQIDDSPVAAKSLDAG